jgi:hypothetical protein
LRILFLPVTTVYAMPGEEFFIHSGHRGIQQNDRQSLASNPAQILYNIHSTRAAQTPADNGQIKLFLISAGDECGSESKTTATMAQFGKQFGLPAQGDATRQ